MTAQLPDEQSTSPQLDPDADDQYLRKLGFTPSLSRSLGMFSSFALQFGNLAPIGAIVFTLSVGLAAAGPALLWPWLIAGGLQLLVAFCVAEACSAYPVAGGAYNIVSRLGGGFTGWQVGWWLEMAHIFSLASSCVGITPVILSWFGVTTGHWGTVGFSALLIGLSTLINVASVKFSARFVTIGVIGTLVACVLVTVVLGGALVFGDHPVNGASFFLSMEGAAKPGVVMPLLFAVLLPTIAINGFDISGNASEETKDAARVVPKAMIRANLVAFGFGTVVIALLLLAMGSVTDTLAATNSVTFIVDPVLGHAIAKTLEVLAVLGLFVCAVVLHMAGARVLWAQARDGKLPLSSKFAHLGRENVPVFAVCVSAVIAILSTIWSSLYAVLIAMTVVLWVGGYATLLVTFWWGKRHGRVPHATFRVRGWKFVFPICIVWSAVLAAVLIYQDPIHVGLGILITAAAGVLVYWLSPHRRTDALARSGSVVGRQGIPITSDLQNASLSPELTRNTARPEGL